MDRKNGFAEIDPPCRHGGLTLKRYRYDAPCIKRKTTAVVGEETAFIIFFKLQSAVSHTERREMVLSASNLIFQLRRRFTDDVEMECITMRALQWDYEVSQSVIHAGATVFFNE